MSPSELTTDGVLAVVRHLLLEGAGDERRPADAAVDFLYGPEANARAEARDPRIWSARGHVLRAAMKFQEAADAFAVAIRIREENDAEEQKNESSKQIHSQVHGNERDGLIQGTSQCQESAELLCMQESISSQEWLSPSASTYLLYPGTAHKEIMTRLTRLRDEALQLQKESDEKLWFRRFVSGPSVKMDEHGSRLVAQVVGTDEEAPVSSILPSQLHSSSKSVVGQMRTLRRRGASLIAAADSDGALRAAGVSSESTRTSKSLMKASGVPDALMSMTAAEGHDGRGGSVGSVIIYDRNESVIAGEEDRNDKTAKSKNMRKVDMYCEDNSTPWLGHNLCDESDSESNDSFMNIRGLDQTCSSTFRVVGSTKCSGGSASRSAGASTSSRQNDTSAPKRSGHKRVEKFEEGNQLSPPPAVRFDTPRSKSTTTRRSRAASRGQVPGGRTPGGNFSISEYARRVKICGQFRRRKRVLRLSRNSCANVGADIESSPISENGKFTLSASPCPISFAPVRSSDDLFCNIHGSSGNSSIDFSATAADGSAEDVTKVVIPHEVEGFDHSVRRALEGLTRINSPVSSRSSIDMNNSDSNCIGDSSSHSVAAFAPERGNCNDQVIQGGAEYVCHIDASAPRSAEVSGPESVSSCNCESFEASSDADTEDNSVCWCDCSSGESGLSSLHSGSIGTCSCGASDVEQHGCVFPCIEHCDECGGEIADEASSSGNEQDSQDDCEWSQNSNDSDSSSDTILEMSVACGGMLGQRANDESWVRRTWNTSRGQYSESSSTENSGASADGHEGSAPSEAEATTANETNRSTSLGSLRRIYDDERNADTACFIASAGISDSEDMPTDPWLSRSDADISFWQEEWPNREGEFETSHSESRAEVRAEQSDSSQAYRESQSTGAAFNVEATEVVGRDINFDFIMRVLELTFEEVAGVGDNPLNENGLYMGSSGAYRELLSLLLDDDPGGSSTTNPAMSRNQEDDEIHVPNLEDVETPSGLSHRTLDHLAPRHILARDVCTTPALCVICTERLDQGIVRQLPCDGKHTFHVLCIDKWLRRHPTCPSCRMDFSQFRS